MDETFCREIFILVHVKVQGHIHLHFKPKSCILRTTVLIYLLHFVMSTVDVVFIITFYLLLLFFILVCTLQWVNIFMVLKWFTFTPEYGETKKNYKKIVSVTYPICVLSVCVFCVCFFYLNFQVLYEDLIGKSK